MLAKGWHILLKLMGNTFSSLGLSYWLYANRNRYLFCSTKRRLFVTVLNKWIQNEPGCLCLLKDVYFFSKGLSWKTVGKNAEYWKPYISRIINFKIILPAIAGYWKPYISRIINFKIILHAIILLVLMESLS